MAPIPKPRFMQTLYITNLACGEIIMKIIQSLFIHRFKHSTHK
jgi:hypothetical protein